MSSGVASSGVVGAPCIVRRIRPPEIEAVRHLAAAIPTAAHWSREEYEKYGVMAQPGDAQVKALFVARTSDGVVGFAAYSLLAETGECMLENMAVAEPWRRQGIARRLLTVGLLWHRTWYGAERSADPASAAALCLEVRASNQGAIVFYESAGFAATGRRPRYYAQPEEDAVLLARPLDEPSPRR